MVRDRARWLAKPWFFASVVLLALNDHVFKALWPGLITGKLSDFAGLVVVATLVSVLAGRSVGIVLAGAGFAALKTVPGVAETVAPLLGGVTLRDTTDLIALGILPVLWLGLGLRREENTSRMRRCWQALGLIGAVFATTATSYVPPTIDALGVEAGVFYAQLSSDDGIPRWVASTDGGATWTRTSDRKPISSGASNQDNRRQVCVEGVVCYSYQQDGHTSGSDDVRYMLERWTPQTDWVADGQISWPQNPRSRYVYPGIAVSDTNSEQAFFLASGNAFYRAGSGDWRSADPFTAVNQPSTFLDTIYWLGHPMFTFVLAALLSIMCWTVVRQTTWRILLQLGVVAFLAVGIFTFTNGVPDNTRMSFNFIGAAILAVTMGGVRFGWWLKNRKPRRFPDDMGLKTGWSRDLD
ncbi:MAG: hypothetical protein FWG47_08430 [Propionibacteriaceae bacterium]|nr:hypothetical protein [Propionibacteriaceae bacterium]